jgi:hypothetical protein
MTRILALLDKDVADLRQNPSLFIPAVLTGLFSILLPFVVAIMIPAFAGERLSDSSDFEIVVETYKNQPAMRGLDPEGTIQAWIFQHFLVLLVLTPIAGAMSVAAFSVIGEKQARTLEPLLATPITTFELLAAKVLGSLLPALLLTVLCFGADECQAASVSAICRASGHEAASMTRPVIVTSFGNPAPECATWTACQRSRLFAASWTIVTMRRASRSHCATLRKTSRYESPGRGPGSAGAPGGCELIL